MGVISAFGFAQDNIKSRNGDVFVGERVSGDTQVMYNMGSVQDVQVRGTKVTSGRDNHQREKQTGFDLEIVWTLRQTEYSTEVANLDALLDNANALGLQLIITDAAICGTSVTDSSDQAKAARDGGTAVCFNGVVPTADFTFDYNGEDSTIEVMVTGRIPISEAIKIGNSCVTLGGC